MTNFRIEAIPAGDTAALSHCHHIRHAVFCVEQAVPEDVEWDDLDNQCRHYLAFAGAAPVATARVRPYGPSVVKIERVAALKSHRGGGLGRALMERVLADARAGGAQTAILNAQVAVETFYALFGFTRDGEPFVEADIPHVQMRMSLNLGA